MKSFIGKMSANNAPLSNGQLMILLKQYRTGKPIDRIHYVLYPDYSKRSSVIGEAGIDTLVNDYEYPTVNYDFYQKGGYVAIDSARYIDGLGSYEVISHQGFIRLRTTTWVDYDHNFFIRKIEVSSLRKNSRRRVKVVPRISLMGEICSEKDGVIIAEIFNSSHIYAAMASIVPVKGEKHYNHSNYLFKRESSQVCVPENLASDDYYIGEADIDEKILNWAPELITLPNLSFETELEIGNSWSTPVYLICGLGKDKNSAYKNLIKAENNPEESFAITMRKWKNWTNKARNLEIPIKFKNIEYKITLSKVIIKKSLQCNGLAPFIGFRKYQGNIWVRDSLWISMTFSNLGYEAEAYGILNSLSKILEKDEDGYIYCVYDGKTTTNIEDKNSKEYDFAGLIISAVWYLYINSGKQKYLGKFKPLLIHCAEWICKNQDHTGLIKPCCGIWECFTPVIPGFQYEHMAWSSCISAFGLKTAAEICKILSENDLSKKYMTTSVQILNAVNKHIVRDNVLCRSLESNHMDASVLLFFTWFPLYEKSSPIFKNTIKMIDSKLKDHALGGIWRHDEMTYIRGDGQPWIGTTLWLVEAYVCMGNINKAVNYLKWVLAHTTQCGLFPEAVMSKEIIEGASMSSYAHGGFLSALYRIKNVLEG
ncbi:MAG: hypothetical protein PHX78_11725 [bacterium]|nr:hypothetical protein [bacterium]